MGQTGPPYVFLLNSVAVPQGRRVVPLVHMNTRAGHWSVTGRCRVSIPGLQLGDLAAVAREGRTVAAVRGRRVLQGADEEKVGTHPEGR